MKPWLNQFYDKKKDKDGKPYHSTLLRKTGIIYGQFIGGKYDKEYFRMFTSPNNIGITYDTESQSAIDPEEGTLEYVVIPALVQMNEIRTQNGKKALSRVSHDQCDVKLSIRTNEKKNFLPLFTFDGLTAMRWYDNTEDVKYIHDLKEEHFRSIFGQMGTVTPIAINGTNSIMSFPKVTTQEHIAIEAPLAVSDLDDTFGHDDKEDF